MVLVEIKLSDLGRNFTDLPTVEIHLYQNIIVLLLKLSQFCVNLEDLVEIRVIHASTELLTHDCSSNDGLWVIP